MRFFTSDILPNDGSDGTISFSSLQTDKGLPIIGDEVIDGLGKLLFVADILSSGEILLKDRIDSGSGGGGVQTVNWIAPTNGNVNVSVNISQAEYDLIAVPDPNVTYYITVSGGGGGEWEPPPEPIGSGVQTVNGIAPDQNSNVNVSVNISQAAYDLIAIPDPNVTYLIY